MTRRPGLPPPQLRALDRLKSVRGGMTDKLWKAIRRYFEEQAPPLVLSLERQRK